MYFDSLTTAAIAAELRAELLDGRVQEVLLPDSLSVALEVYAGRQRRYLLASAHPQTARVHLVTEKARRGVDSVLPLLLLLRKHVRGARLVDVRQPPAERILHLLFEGIEGQVSLVVEVIGRYSNLVLVAEDGTVLDAIKRVGPELNRYRVLLPNHAYSPPPPQDKLLPEQVTEYGLRQLLAQSPPETPLPRLLVAGLAGISPLAAREIVFRALGDADAPASALDRITPLLEAHHALTLAPPQPCIARDEEDGRVAAFAPYALTHLGTWEPVGSLSAALEAYYGDQAAGYQAAKAALFEAIEAGRQRMVRRRAMLGEDRSSAGDPEALRHMGEAILAYAHHITAGQSELVAEWLPGEPPLRIALDPALTPSQNAQSYFRRYRKAQRGSVEIPAQLAQVEAEEAYLDQLAQDLAMAEDRPEIDAVRAVLVQAGYAPSKRKPLSTAPARPRRLASPDGFTVWVGKNALQNDSLTFRQAAPHDLWLHARGLPGAHVIVQSEGRPLPERTVEWAAALAAYYSRGRDDTRVAVDVVERRHVRRLKGGRPGQVVYRRERTLHVAPRPPE